MPEDRRKHLEFIQAVITRQANNSFVVRGWALTVAAAVFGFAANKGSWAVAVIGVIASMAFYYMDAFYLRQERLFRCLYQAVVEPDSAVPLYSMDTRPYRQNQGSRWTDVLRARPIIVLFGGMVVAGAVIALATGLTYSAKDCRSNAASASSSPEGVGTTSGQISPNASPGQRGSTCT
jgi:hypothetical protein